VTASEKTFNKKVDGYFEKLSAAPDAVATTQKKPQAKAGIMELITSKAATVDIVRAKADLSIARILETKPPALSLLRKQYSPEKVEAAIAILMIDTSTWFSAPMPQEQAQELAAEITATNYWLSLEDVFLILQRLKRKELYGKLTPNKVMLELAAYTSERLNESAQRSYHQHLDSKEKVYDRPDDGGEAVRIEENFNQFKDSRNPIKTQNK
jgi:hypothetical protein